MINKTKLIAFSILICSTILQVNAQESAVKVTYKINTNKSVDFQYQKDDPGSFSMMMKFRDLTNAYFSDRDILRLNNYSGRLLSLTPENKEQGIGFSYSYSFIRGKLNPKFDADFVYLLPYKKGTNVRVANVGYVGTRYFGKDAPEDWSVYRFFTDVEDSVTAIRKGVVVDIKDLHNTNEDSNVEYTSRINELTIEHADGTLAVYKGFKKGSYSVKIGQTVYPGSPLGLNTKQYVNSKFNVSIYIIYLKSMDFESARNPQNPKSLYGFIKPHFYTSANPATELEIQKEYTVEETSDIVKKEFSKKELKAGLK